jgi:hypothetical protein
MIRVEYQQDSIYGYQVEDRLKKLNTSLPPRSCHSVTYKSVVRKADLYDH